MKTRGSRIILFLASAALSSPLLFKGHGISREDRSVAFLPYTSSVVTVRLTGDLVQRGVFAFGKEVGVEAVINMTTPLPTAGILNRALLDRQLRSGDIINISLNKQQKPEISLLSMKARERMLLGIPLHPDQMDLEDWRSLPGIGPILGRCLFEDRQKYGDYLSIEALQRVPGIGEKKYNSLKKFF